MACALLIGALMQNALTPLTALPARTAELWRAIEDSVCEACVLRAEGREPEAIIIVQQKLPAMIAHWSRGAGLAAEHCRQTLRELFARVQQQVATATICKRLVLRSVDAAAPVRDVNSQHVQIRRRVPLDDIPAMLDALDESERSAVFRRQNFPSSALTAKTAMALG